MKNYSYYFFTLLVIFMSAIYLPLFYEKIFFNRIERTHLFYSPVSNDFILKEKIVGPIPGAIKEKAEDHHSEIAYQNADGSYVSRVEFEKHLPFIYYKNMELWGLLPIELNHQLFNSKNIKNNRRVMELLPREIHGRSPYTMVWPLLESNRGRVRLVFPEDRFRMTPSSMEFINADTLTVDQSLTTLFTQALTKKGFTFPCRSVNGKFTVLKPFEGGIFLVDADNEVFHLKRINNRPWVVKTPIDPDIGVRHIKISESRQKDYDGLILGKTGQVYLLSHDQYRVIPLPLEKYVPEQMRLKLIFNPLYCTAVFSDETNIYGVAMDRNFNVIKRFSHTMSRSAITPAHRVYQFLFPFSLSLEKRNSGFLSFAMEVGHLSCIAGIVFCLFFYIGWTMLIQKRRFSVVKAVMVGITGIYGLLALQLSPLDD